MFKLTTSKSLLKSTFLEVEIEAIKTYCLSQQVLHVFGQLILTLFRLQSANLHHTFLSWQEDDELGTPVDSVN